MLDSYYLHAIIISMIFLLPAHGLNLIVGYTGMLSLAQAAFFGIGAYVSALMAMHFGTPFYVNFVAGRAGRRADRAAAWHSGAAAADLLLRDVHARLRRHRAGGRQELDRA